MLRMKLTNVCKFFNLYRGKLDKAKYLFRSAGSYSINKRIAVLDNINFEIQAGETVGIIGINGSGKSTLLKIIAGTLLPTSGNITLNGKVSAILELGVGFDMDYTGYENIVHSTKLLGISRDETKQILESIVQFSGIEDYLDEPLRVYSSGMQSRLAFSVATAKRPDILIVDEALSVGDENFQSKCFDRIREFKRLGTSILMVSHDKNSILSICDRAILLDQGSVVADGTPQNIYNHYNAILSRHSSNINCDSPHPSDIEFDRINQHGTGEASLKSISLLDYETLQDIELVNIGQKVLLKLTIKINADLPKINIGYSIRNRYGQVAYGTNTMQHGIDVLNVTKEKDVTVEFVFNANLGVGAYSISTAIVNSLTHLDKNYQWKNFALNFEVVNHSNPSFEGYAYLEQSIKVYS